MSPTPIPVPSGFECVRTLEPAGQDAIRSETPLFAAGARFAYDRGGPLTRAFLDALPEPWPAELLVLDSFLVWLRPHLCPGTPEWHHEVFPGQHENARGLANRERDVEHAACCFGTASLPEFLVGDVRLVGAPSEEASVWFRCTDLAARGRTLEAQLAAGDLAIRAVPPWTVYRYGWGSFQRAAPATESGFVFLVRATRGSSRPLVNGLRNVTNL